MPASITLTPVPSETTQAPPGTYTRGEQVQIQFTVKDIDGVPTEPDDLTFTVRAPDGVDTDYVMGADPEIINNADGTGYLLLVLDQSARWLFRCVTDTPTGAAEVDAIVTRSPFEDPVIPVPGAPGVAFNGRIARVASGTYSPYAGEQDEPLVWDDDTGWTARPYEVASFSDPSGAYNFNGRAIAGNITCDVLTLRGCAFTGAHTIVANTINIDRASSRALQASGSTVSTLPNDLEPSADCYGRGGDGALSVSSGTADANAGQQWSSITLSGTAVLTIGREILRVQGLLGLASAQAGAIVGTAGGATHGGNASGATGGSAGAGQNGVIHGTAGMLGGTAGETGTTGAGATPTAATAIRYAYGGGSGGGGKGGDGSKAGGAAGAAPTTTSPRNNVPTDDVRFIGPPALGATDYIAHGGQTGRAGSSGGGDGSSGTGGGGGGSGSGANSMVIYARGIQLGPFTAAGAISNAGRNGGNGGNGSGANCGGGGGAGGSGGGPVIIIYDWLIGTNPASGQIVAPGGNGGNGGNGGAGAGGGDGGTGGDGGQIILINRITGARSRTTGSAGTAGSAASGTTGGAGGAGGACSASFP